MKYQIGSVVWFAEWKSGEDYITCPDCYGKKYLTVILGDDSQVTINCAGCSVGYEPPRGTIKIYTAGPSTRQVEITGVNRQRSKEDDSVLSKYSFSGGYEVEEERLFDTHEEALVAANAISEKWCEDENKRLLAKTKDHHSWAWHVTYYRREINEAKSRIERATKQLNAAMQHVKAVPAEKP